MRLAAFEWLQEQVLIYGDVLPRDILEKGYEYQGERITLIGPSGIWKPRQFTLPLSITTVYDNPYKDSLGGENFLYHYRGEDPYHRDNAGLREVMRQRVPLIYFFAIVKGRYLPTWPAFVIKDEPQMLTFTVQIDDKSSISSDSAEANIRYFNNGTIHERSSQNGALLLQENEDYVRRSYISATVKVRLHQKSFRERVIEAYQQQCAFCRLKHTELLDAAHIIPDSDIRGEPLITNGLSLCKIHHAAFDSNLISVTPQYRIAVRRDVLAETDGPMLRYGIQQLNNQVIILPNNKKYWPDRERLETRYERFIKAG